MIIIRIRKNNEHSLEETLVIHRTGELIIRYDDMFNLIEITFLPFTSNKIQLHAFQVLITQ